MVGFTFRIRDSTPNRRAHYHAGHCRRHRVVYRDPKPKCAVEDNLDRGFAADIWRSANVVYDPTTPNRLYGVFRAIAFFPTGALRSTCHAIPVAEFGLRAHHRFGKILG